MAVRIGLSTIYLFGRFVESTFHLVARIHQPLHCWQNFRTSVRPASWLVVYDV